MLQPILFTAVGVGATQKAKPIPIVPSNLYNHLTTYGIEFVRLLNENPQGVANFLDDISRGDSQKVMQLKNELAEMSKSGIILFDQSYTTMCNYRFELRKLVKINREYRVLIPTE